MRIPPVVEVWMFPWKSLKASSWTFTSLGFLMVVVALVRGRGAGQDEQKRAGRPEQAKD